MWTFLACSFYSTRIPSHTLPFGIQSFAGKAWQITEEPWETVILISTWLGMKEQQCNCKSDGQRVIVMQWVLHWFCETVLTNSLSVFRGYYFYPSFMHKSHTTQKCTCNRTKKEGFLFYRWGIWNTGKWPFQLVRETSCRQSSKCSDLCIKTYFPKQKFRVWWGTIQNPCTLIRWNNLISARLWLFTDDIMWLRSVIWMSDAKLKQVTWWLWSDCVFK